MCRRIGSEREVMLFSGGAKAVEDDSWLDTRNAALGINLEDVRHVLRKIEDDGGVATLSGERSATAASQQRSTVFAANGDGREHVFFVARNDHSDWHLAVVGAVGRVESAAAGVEADLSAKMTAQRSF